MFKIQFPSVSFGLSEKSQNQYLQSLRATIYIQWQYASFFFSFFCRTEVHTGQRRWLHGSWFHFGLTLLSYHAFRGRKASVFTMGLYGIKELINQTRIRKKENLHTHCLFPISSEIRRWGKIVFLSFQFNVAAGLPRSFAAPVNFAIMSFSKGETDLMTKPEGPRVKEVRVIWGRGEATAQDRLLVLYFEHEGSGGVLLTDTYLISFQSRISLCGDIDE